MIRTTRIPLNVIINQLYELGLKDAERLGHLADTIHRAAQAFVTSRYSFSKEEGSSVISICLPLRMEPSKAEMQYLEYLRKTIRGEKQGHWHGVDCALTDDGRGAYCLQFRTHED